MAEEKHAGERTGIKGMKKEDKHYLLSSDKTLDLIYYEDADASYPLHTHAEHDTLGVVLDGTVVIETKEGRTVCGKKNMFTIPMDMPHAVYALNGYSYTMLTVCIHADYTDEREILGLGQRLESRLAILSDKGVLLKSYIPLLQNGFILLVESRLKRLKREGCLEELKAGLLELPELPLAIEAMSERVCVSPFHLIRQFKKETGLTPHQFQIQCRIRKAQRLLLEYKTVTEVAFETGFCDQSHFDKSFKRIVGMSPTAYQGIARLTESREEFGKEK